MLLLINIFIHFINLLRNQNFLSIDVGFFFFFLETYPKHLFLIIYPNEFINPVLVNLCIYVCIYSYKLKKNLCKKDAEPIASSFRKYFKKKYLSSKR